MVMVLVESNLGLFQALDELPDQIPEDRIVVGSSVPSGSESFVFFDVAASWTLEAFGSSEFREIPSVLKDFPRQVLLHTQMVHRVLLFPLAFLAGVS